MKCLETRARANGIKSRRYELDDGRRLTTYEVPASVLKSIGMGRVMQELRKWERGEVQRAKTHARREQVVAMLKDGIKPLAIAHEVGVTEARVRQIRQEIQK